MSEDRFYYLGPSGALRIPNIVMPPLMNNHGNYIVSLGNVVRWLGEQAAELGVDIYPEFAAVRSSVRREGRGHRRCHRRQGHRQGRRADRPLPARHRAQGQVHRDRRGRARLAGQDADGQIRARQRPPATEVRPWPQGAVGGAARTSTSRGWCSTRWAGRSTIAPAAARSSITTAPTWCRSASSCT